MGRARKLADKAAKIAKEKAVPSVISAEAKEAQIEAKRLEREAAKAQALAEKKVAKAAAETEQKAKHTAVIGKLNPIAKEINVRLEKADKLEEDADDHRLAAALQFKAAHELCKTNGIKFKEWAETNVTKSYETVRKLVAIGLSDNPALALEDARGKNKEANKKAREKAKKSGGKKEKKADPEQVILSGLDGLKDERAVKLVTVTAEKHGFKLVDKAELDDLRKVAKTPVASVARDNTVEQLQKDFGLLKSADKVKFTVWAAKQVGFTITSAVAEATAKAEAEDNDPGIPASLKR